MDKLTSFERAEKRLRELLVGNWFSGVEVGDCWTLRFKDVFLVAHNLIGPEEDRLNELLATAKPPVLDGVDAENVAKGILVLRAMRQTVVDVALAADGALHLIFGDGRSLIASASMDGVDWQWVVNISGSEPYHEYVVACFAAGEVSMEELPM